MEETKKLSTEELTQVKELQQKFQSAQFEFGEIEIAKLQLEKRYENAKEFLSNLQKEEETFSQSLFEKYGKIDLNLETGEYKTVE
jgi:hypothetical protein